MAIGSVNPPAFMPQMASTSTAGATTSAAGTGAEAPGREASANEAADRFLKLLVAQMRNQDPLNPLDNAQVTSQMAQISTVQGIEKLNTSMQSMLTQSNAVQQLSSAGLIGRRVLVEGNTVELTGGTGRTSGAKAGFALDAPASAVRVEVLDSTGSTVSSRTLQSLDAGVHIYEWDGKSDSGRALADGKYQLRVSAAVGSEEMKPIEALQAATVTAVTSPAQGAVRVEIGSAGQRSVDSVRAVL